MLSIRPYQRCTNSAVNNRMKPPRQIRSILCWSSADCSTASNAARSLPNGLLSMVTAAIPRCLGLFETAGIGPVGDHDRDLGREIRRLAASISAAMFDPRPEIRMATRRFIASPRQIEMAVIDHAMLALGLDHLAQQRDALAAFGENVGDLLDRVRSRRSRSCRCRN